MKCFPEIRLFFGGERLQLKGGFGKALITAERQKRLLPQHPGVLDMSVTTTSKHVGIFPVAMQLCAFAAFIKCGVQAERIVGTETL